MNMLRKTHLLQLPLVSPSVNPMTDYQCDIKEVPHMQMICGRNYQQIEANWVSPSWISS